MYMEGQGAPQDYAEALKWFRLAAMQGHADAQHNLGYMYDNGLGVPQDYTNAAIWFLRAAERGYANSQLRLGALYFLGRVGPADLVQAYKWISLALSGFTADEDRKRAHKVFDTVTPLMTAAKTPRRKRWRRRGNGL